MSGTKNLNQFLDNFSELERKIECGYIPDDVAYKLDIFARSNLANGVLSLFSSFNNLNPFLDTPTELFIASNSISDTFDVFIDYIDQDRNRKTKTITLTGTTPISLGSDIYCVFRMINNGSVNQVGTNVYITTNATGVPANANQIYSEMTVTSGLPANISLTSFYSIPIGYTGFVTKAYINVEKGGDVKAALFTRPENGVFRFVKGLESFQSQAMVTNMFDRIKEKTDLRPIAIAQTGAITYVDYTVLVISNEYLNNYTGGI